MRKIKTTGRSARSAVRNSLSKSPACKVFFPFNEGSGDVFTDIAGNAQFISLSTDHSREPHAPALYVNGSLSSGGFPTIQDGKKIIWIKCLKHTVGGPVTAHVIMGDGAAPSSASPSIGFDNDSGVGLFITTAPGVGGRDVVWWPNLSDYTDVLEISGVTWDSDTKEAKAYYGINNISVAMTEKGPVEGNFGSAITNSVAKGVNTDWPISPSIKIGTPTPSLTPAIYSMFMYIVDDLPSESETIEGLNWMKAAHSSGHKELFPGFYSL